VLKSWEVVNLGKMRRILQNLRKSQKPKAPSPGSNKLNKQIVEASQYALGFMIRRICSI
jgi:hypothetical protein